MVRGRSELGQFFPRVGFVCVGTGVGCGVGSNNGVSVGASVDDDGAKEIVGSRVPQSLSFRPSRNTMT